MNNNTHTQTFQEKLEMLFSEKEYQYDDNLAVGSSVIRDRDFPALIQEIISASQSTPQPTEQQVLICENCKRYWTAPKEVCECGSKSLAPTHPSNANKVEPKPSTITEAMYEKVKKHILFIAGELERIAGCLFEANKTMSDLKEKLKLEKGAKDAMSELYDDLKKEIERLKSMEVYVAATDDDYSELHYSDTEARKNGWTLSSIGWLKKTTVGGL